MDLSHEVSNGVRLVGPKGRIDSATAAAFESQCAALIEEGPNRIVLDFAQVDYISSAGLRAVLIAAKKARTLGGALTLCGLRDNVKEVMSVSGFDALLGAHPGVEDAIAALSR
jgi:anti-anti-sigma factor